MFRHGLLPLLSVALFTSFLGLNTPPPSELGRATYTNGLLRASLPYEVPRSGSGVLRLEILDPDDSIVAYSQQPENVSAGRGNWHQEVNLSEKLPIEDVVWYRLRYKFKYKDADKPVVDRIQSLSQLIRIPTVHVLGQSSYLAGATAAVRLVVTDTQNELIPGTSSARIELQAPDNQTRLLFTGRLDSRGTTNASFNFPTSAPGSYSLRYTVQTTIGSAEFTQPIRIEEKVGILLSTEKPIYQPGQTIHVRALALDRSNHEATAGHKLTFELEDSRGNKVFRKLTQTDTFGVASAEFTLADEVNLGTYHLRASIEGVDDQSRNTAEVALNVDRYVLPKFKVAVDLAEKGQAAKHGFRPGDHVTGTVRANYFFGKPVNDAEIAVKASAMDVEMFNAATEQGRTDHEGVYRFDLPLPGYFAGRPLSQGAARVLLEATVKDSAGHIETRGEPITVSDTPLLITAVPESGTLIPGLENQVFILTSYPDGTPAKTDLQVHASPNLDRSATTDESGIAIVQILGNSANTSILVEAQDRGGNRTQTTVPLQLRSGADQILLRTERAVYRVGERIQLRLFSSKQHGAAYVDVIKDGQTVETRDVDIVNGQATLEIPATPQFSGTVEMNAYLFGQNAVAVSDHRLVFVQPADELKVETTLDSAEYKPGGEAHIAFRVTNNKGQGVSAALGAQIVDEAVFALAEKQPGFAKVFFYLEQEVMKPRYEIHSVDMRESIEPLTPVQTEQHDRAARALFSATDLVRTNAYRRDFGQDTLLAKQWEYVLRYRARLDKQTRQITELVNAELQSDPDIPHAIHRIPAEDLVDPWGEKIQIELPRSARNVSVVLRSAGPDQKLNTADDLTESLWLSEHRGKKSLQQTVVRQFIANDLMAQAGFAEGVMGGAVGGVGMPPPVPTPRFQRSGATQVGNGKASEAPHIRSFFPEALYINPEIITDPDGRASITVPIADNITTWRLAMLASTTHGALGDASSSLKVFQDFFVDLDLPVTLTQGDQVSIPVAVYNYSGTTGKVSLQLQPDNWFSLVADSAEKAVDVASDRVGASQFNIQAKQIGKFKLTLSARMSGSSKRADIVVREIEVVPNGREQDSAFNGTLENSVEQNVSFPAQSIPEARTIFVRLYPSPLSQVLEGMDSLLRMPNGCFEQTSSSTYPNVLALDYMKRTKKLTPEVHVKAEGYIANGYQRLLTFEVPGGGFSWFGQAPANKILTSYGLMEFSDMSKVHDVDDRIISRTQQWLATQQQSDGSWKPDQSFINEGATNRFNSDVLRITAYIAWALETTGYHGNAVESAKHFIESNLNANVDAYTLAILGNFAVDYGKDRAFTNEVMKLLVDARTEENKQAWWNVEETALFAHGKSAAVETTGLAVQALLKSGEEPALTRRAISYITAAKDASGTWGTTQATIMALRALLLATEKGSGTAKGAVEIVWNGKTAAKLDLTDNNNDLLHQFVLKTSGLAADNEVAIRFNGQGSVGYQIAGRYFLPWDERPANEALSIDVKYDRTRLSQDDIATATATVRNNLDDTAKMVMVDLGIPPGFELLTEDLDSYKRQSTIKSSGRLEKFSLTATQAILYFDSIAAHDSFSISFRLRAKYPIRTRTFASRVYEYYDPIVSSLAQPVQLQIDKHM